MLHNLRLSLLIIATTLLVIGGCGKRPVVNYSQPELPTSGYYELVWEDPRVLVSDSLYTLIRSQRIDSFYVEKPRDPFGLSDRTLVFQISDDACFVAINLYDAQGKISRPLLVRNLSRGFYKFSVDLGQLYAGNRTVRTSFLKADVCGFEVSKKIDLLR